MTESNQAPEPAPAAEPAPYPGRRDTSGDIADRIFNRITKVGPSALAGGELIQRKTKTFLLDGASCSPFFFWDEGTGDYLDVEVTVRSLTTVEEIEALKGMTDPGQVPWLLARASLWALNGTPIPYDRKDFFWEGFGMGGRQLAMMAFQHIGSASQVALGKFQSSISVG